MSNSNSGNQQYEAFTIDRDKEGVDSVTPVYVPTTPNTDLRTPQNGHNTMSSIYFPCELLFEIFYKLPAKTLLRFQCVSKSIQAMITDPHFISMHHNWSARNHSRYMLIRNHHQHGDREQTISCFSRFDQKISVSELNFMKLHDDHDLQGIDINTISNSCDGFFCLTNKKTNYQSEEIPCIYLWNPSIRIVKKLPDESSFTPKDCTIIRIMNSLLCGVGFDTKNNDHKVMQIIYAIIRRPNNNNYYFFDGLSRVYSLRTNSWRWLEGNPAYDTIPLYAEACTTSINGSLYWIIPQCIMSFSFSDEIFRKIALPHFDDNMTSTRVVGERLCGGIIGTLEKSLALFVQSGESMIVWLMKEIAEGGIGSWSKKFSINVGNCKVWPINFGVEGKLILMRGFETSLELWDLEKQTFEGIDIDKDDDVDVYTYSDSLVLLN